MFFFFVVFVVLTAASASASGRWSHAYQQLDSRNATFEFFFDGLDGGGAFYRPAKGPKDFNLGSYRLNFTLVNLGDGEDKFALSFVNDQDLVGGIAFVDADSAGDDDGDDGAAALAVQVEALLEGGTEAGVKLTVREPAIWPSGQPVNFAIKVSKDLPEEKREQQVLYVSLPLVEMTRSAPLLDTTSPAATVRVDTSQCQLTKEDDEDLETSSKNNETRSKVLDCEEVTWRAVFTVWDERSGLNRVAVDADEDDDSSLNYSRPSFLVGTKERQEVEAEASCCVRAVTAAAWDVWGNTMAVRAVNGAGGQRSAVEMMAVVALTVLATLLL